MTTSSPTTSPPELFVLERPKDVSAGRWKAIQVAAHKVVTGHYPVRADQLENVERARLAGQSRRL